MKGITKDELYDYLEHFRDVEFVIDNVEYTIVVDLIDNLEYFTVSKCISKDEDKFEYIYKCDVTDKPINKEFIDQFLEEKIFDGKSFNELNRKINVTCIL